MSWYTWIHKLRFEHLFRKDLDTIFEQVPSPERPIRVRMNWLADLLQWIRSQGMISHQMDFSSGAPQALRVKYMMQVLNRNPKWKQRSGETIASILHETSMTSLFATTGLIERESFWTEVSTRLGNKLLPKRPLGRDLKYFFEIVLNSPTDYLWVRRLEESTVEQVFDWINTASIDSEAVWQHILDEEREAALILTGHLRSMGFHPKVLERIEPRSVSENPFFRLDSLLIKALIENDSSAETRSEITSAIAESRGMIQEVIEHLDDFGIDINTVFLIDRMELALKRLQDLWMLMRPTRSVRQTLNFLSLLIEQSYDRRSLKGLFSDTFSLVSRDISERTAAVGEHYITRTWPEYRQMFRRALGGGAVTALTTLVKFGVTSIAFAGLVGGFFASLNYAVSFVIIHLFGWTLATKQPSTTGPALAARMSNLETDEDYQTLVRDISHVARTQFIGVVGNVIAVVPITFLICFLYVQVLGTPLISPYVARYSIDSFSILGPTVVFAAFTGILLWLSSVIAGWVDNWFAYHRLFRAIKFNRRLTFAFGERTTTVMALWLRRNMSPLAANISLGILLGLTPAVLNFIGIPLEVRHVTLAAGALAASLASTPISEMPWNPTILAILGITVTGALNIVVSFSFALIVAMNARKINSDERKQIFAIIREEIRKNPRAFFFPGKPKNNDPEKQQAATHSE